MVVIRNIFLLLCITIFCFTSFAIFYSGDSFGKASVRLKDIVSFEGFRDNVLVGYGLVVGLNGTGDNIRNAAFTEKGLVDFLDKLGVSTRGYNIKTKNVAAVMVTTSVNAFARGGSRTSVQISTIGDAKSIKGGTLLATPLLGPDGEVYAIAQGSVSIGKPTSELDSRGQQNKKFLQTSGYVNNGAIIEREIQQLFSQISEIKIALKNPDITTAKSIALAINSNSIDSDTAFALDPGTVSIKVPKERIGNLVEFLSEVENIEIEPDVPAKVIIDEASGTVVIGENVKIDAVAISQGNLQIKIGAEDNLLSSFLNSKKDEEEFSEPGTKLSTLKSTADLGELIAGLNALAVKTEDLISILKSMQNIGALHAVIEVR